MAGAMSDGRTTWAGEPQTIAVINEWIRTRPRSEIDATIRALNDIVKRATEPPRPALVSLK